MNLTAVIVPMLQFTVVLFSAHHVVPAVSSLFCFNYGFIFCIKKSLSQSAQSLMYLTVQTNKT